MFFTFASCYNYENSSFDGNILINIIYFLVITILIFMLWNVLKNIEVKFNKKSFKKIEFLFCSLIFIIPIAIAILAYFPAVGNPDTYSLWEQVNNNNLYGDWHPFIYTILFIKLPSLFSNNIYSTVSIQLVVLFITTMYTYYFLRKKYLPFWLTILIFILFFFNPMVIRFCVFVSKDIPFACCILLSTLYLINILDSDGKWLSNWKNKLVFVLSNIGILTLRHNGIIPFICLFIFMIIFDKKTRKFFVVSFSFIMLSFILLKGPIYDKILFFRSGGKFEAIGIIMGNISYYENNLDLDLKDEEFLYSIYPKEIWQEYYYPRNFNKIKWVIESPGFTERIDDDFYEVLKLWWKYTKKYPNAFIKSYLNMTSPIWSFKDKFAAYDSYTLRGELLLNPINVNSRIFLDSIYKKIKSSIFKYLFISFGEGLFVIIIALFLVLYKKKTDVKYLSPFIPVVFNSLTIMLLITGEEYRFFLAQIVCFLPLILYSLSLKNKND